MKPLTWLILICAICGIHAQNNGTRVDVFVIDVSVDQPALGVPVQLFANNASEWNLVAECVTGSNGSCMEIEDTQIDLGLHKLRYELAAYYNQSGIQCFFPSPEMIFEVKNENERYLIPLIITPYSYSAYRGS